jgi:hypothetical protein
MHAAICGSTGTTYALVDGNAPNIVRFLRDYKLRAYRLVECDEVLNTGHRPWLIDFAGDYKLIKLLLLSCWGKGELVFLESFLPVTDLGRHLRPYLFLRTPTGLDANFRFYDPRVLRMLFRAKGDAQWERFFGPITRFVFEDRWPSFYWSCGIGERRLVPLAPTGYQIPPQAGLRNVDNRTIESVCKRYLPFETSLFEEKTLSIALQRQWLGAESLGFMSNAARAQFVLLCVVLGEKFIENAAIEQWFRKSVLTRESSLNFLTLSINHDLNFGRRVI